MSSLAGRLSLGGGRPLGRPLKESGVLQSRYQYKTSAVSKPLANRLRVPYESQTGLSIGIKARLGPTSNAAKAEFSNISGDQDRRRLDARSKILEARRKLGEQAPSSPVLVKMAGGKMVGGMRSDGISKSRYPKEGPVADHRRGGPKALVAMDSKRGLMVRVENKGRPIGKRGHPTSTRLSGPQKSRRPSSNFYSQHDDRYERDTDEVVSEEGRRPRMNLHLKGQRRRRSPIEDSMDVDSSGGGDVYNASLVYTRTTSHHHHHHHHATSPDYSPEYAIYPQEELPSASHRLLYRHSVSPPPSRREYYRPDTRYASPPPPPSPPSFHPRYALARESPSPSPPPVSKRRQNVLSVVQPKTAKAKRVVSKSAAKVLKAPKLTAATQYKVITKPSKKKTSSKLNRVIKTVKTKPQKIKKMSLKKPAASITISSESSDSSSSSSSSSDSSDSEDAKPVKKAPQPHKQTLDQEVLENIAALQGKDPGYKSGPGPGVKNLEFVPNKTAKSLNQRFTAAELMR